MKPDTFEEPVVILLGLGIPTEVRSVLHAYQILMDWRQGADRARNLALNACRAALSGDVDPEMARAVFVAFAEKHDLIAPQIDSILAGRQNRNSDPYIR
ncbi:DUF982 domain-containing protein [Rhizobium bangladeshense]|uniref:DUF982 domain-containing protein n=1 Tax=Rhizobium bangladeshense TaxID=1138189 RepID=UPI0007E564B0|nr:DUF982 domain-containing protein [Rhizobium bangladeshense]